MSEEKARLSTLVTEAIAGRWSRRDVVRRGVALGLTLPAIGAAISDISARSVSAQDEPVQVSILNKEMSKDEIVAEIQKEGQVNVGNWTYTANDTVKAKFVEHVKSEYGVDITLNYEASQAPSTYITNLYTALQSGNAPSYDVMAIEENYWAEAMSQPEPVAEEYLPSGLVPNAERTLDIFQHFPTAIGFQASATPGIVYDKERAVPCRLAGSGGRAAEGSIDNAVAGRRHLRRHAAGHRRVAWARLQETGGNVTGD